jgi:dGTP triphosphohydrolase
VLARYAEYVYNALNEKNNSEHYRFAQRLKHIYLNTQTKQPKKTPDDFILTMKDNLKKLKNQQDDKKYKYYLNARYFKGEVSDFFMKGLKYDVEFIRCICDHIAGMTDYYALDEFRQLYLQ